MSGQIDYKITMYPQCILWISAPLPPVVLANIEGRENVKRVAKVNFPWNSCITSEDREQVRGTDHGVHMDDGHDPIPIAIEIRLDDPHAVVGVGVFERFAKVVDKGT